MEFSWFCARLLASLKSTMVIAATLIPLLRSGFHDAPLDPGGIEEGEEPRFAAIRELAEETGVVSAEIIDEVPGWLTYDFSPAVKVKVNIVSEMENDTGRHKNG